MFLYEDLDSSESDLLIRKSAVVIKDEGVLLEPLCLLSILGYWSLNCWIWWCDFHQSGCSWCWCNCILRGFLLLRIQNTLSHCLLDDGHCCCHTSVDQLADVVSLIGLRRAGWMLVWPPDATAFRCRSHSLTLAKCPTKLTSIGVVQSTKQEYYYTGSWHHG